MSNLDDQIEKVSRLETIQRVTTAIILSVVLLIGAVILLCFTFEQSSIHYADKRFTTSKSVYHPGDEITAFVERCNTSKRLVVFNVTKTMDYIGYDQESPSYTVGTLRIVAPPGCVKISTVTTMIPLSVKPGLYIIRGSAEVEGITRSFFQDWYTEPFYIITE